MSIRKVKHLNSIYKFNTDIDDGGFRLSVSEINIQNTKQVTMCIFLSETALIMIL